MDRGKRYKFLKDIDTPWGPVGYITYKRTYARKLSSDSEETEEFHDTIARVLAACDTQLNVGFTPEQEKEFGTYLKTLKCSVAGRFWWQLGTETVSKHGLASLQNCAVTVVNEPVRPFTWAMDMLALGCGVGFNIEKHEVAKLPPVASRVEAFRKDEKDADFIVPDTREGWVKLLGKVLKAAFYGAGSFTYSCQLIRSKGAPIKGFGGVASGPDILVEGINKICSVLNAKVGEQLTPTDCLDIMNIIGSIIVAGNVRRSAELAVGSHDDEEYLEAKRWDKYNIPNWRAMSNNSIAVEKFADIPDSFWAGYEGNGEPYGLINMPLSRSVGRLGEDEFSDAKAVCYNPCAEQTLENFETCCLAEVFLPNITSYAELKKVVTYLYRVCKHSLALPCHNKETEQIVNFNMRMGIGMTGVLQATDEQRGWLKDCYTYLRAYDRSYSGAMGWPTSIKLTTVKPSGTLSLLAGVTPGIHPGYSKYHIRRIRISSDSSLIASLKEAGYPMEPVKGFDGSLDHGTQVVSFPCKFPEGTVLAKDMTAIDQIRAIEFMQRNWSDNSVSCTVYYRKEELPKIKEYLERKYEGNIKTISFLLHSDHGFEQAPLEEITEDMYNQMRDSLRDMGTVSFKEEDVDVGEECVGGLCPIK